MAQNPSYYNVKAIALLFNHIFLRVYIHFGYLYSLSVNLITDKGAGTLAEALKVNKSLQNLR